ncbi:MAG: hypothetical protein P8I03_14425 [Thalassotalea sp.]|nr:hypothetical protein [Thalassotalea sp.]
MIKNIWWGDFTFEQQEKKSWSIGDRAIVLKRDNNEWNSWNVETNDENSNDVIVCEHSNLSISENVEIGRYLASNKSNTISITPQLADKSIIARPASPLNILAGETVQLFVSTPVWFCAKSSPEGKVLVDLPFWRPSDSWIGASTIDGQLCYAKYTSAKTNLEDLELRPHRAITPITVINNHHEALVINRINVPVNYLHLYNDENNQLWTSSISIEKENDSDGSDDLELLIDKKNTLYQ